MSRWFRLYEEALEDPTVQRLPPPVFKGWINLLCIASKYDGMLPDFKILAFMLRQREDEVGWGSVALPRLSCSIHATLPLPSPLRADPAELGPANWPASAATLAEQLSPSPAQTRSPQ